MEEIKFKEISIDDKPIFDSFFSTNYINISEYTFTNLFAWRKSRKIEYSIYEESLIIKANYNGDDYFLHPVGKDKKKLYEIFCSLCSLYKIKVIKRIDENEITYLKDCIENKKISYQLIEDRDNFDYIYSVEKLALLNSRKFSSKRNFVTKFSGQYDYQYKDYSEEYKMSCIKLLDNWLRSKSNDDNLKNEYYAIVEMLNNFDRLDVKGAVILVENEVVAFCFGEKLNVDTYVVHFEKANTNYSGAYQMINKLFAEKQLYGKYNFENREQDLGIEGIRKAKLSYYPVNFIKKFNLIIE